MKPNSFCLNRSAFEDLREKLNTKIPDACVALMQHLCIYANHTDGTYRGMTVRRGQIFVGRHQLSTRTGITPQKLRSCLQVLTSNQELTQQPTHHGSLITINRYEVYDGFSDEPTQQVTINQPSSNQQVTTSKEEEQKDNERKEGEKEEEKTPPGHTKNGRPRDVYLDTIQAMLRSAWPELTPPKVSLLAMWRAKFKSRLSEAQILAIVEKVALSGKTFDTTSDLTAYLFGALSKEAERHESQQAHQFIPPAHDPIRRPG